MNEIFFNGFVDEISKISKVDKDLAAANRVKYAPAAGMLGGIAAGTAGAARLLRKVKNPYLQAAGTAAGGILGSAGGTLAGSLYKNRKDKQYLDNLKGPAKARLMAKRNKSNKEMPSFNKSYNKAYSSTSGFNIARRHREALKMLSPKHRAIANKIM